MSAARERSVVVVGGGVIGCAVAWYAMREGFRVTVVERGAPAHESCSTGNAGMVVPSHLVPLAAPGMVATGLKSMFDPRSPVYIRPRLDVEFMRWSWHFFRSATPAHVERSAPRLRDLALLSRRCYEELADARGNDFGLQRNGLLMLFRTEHALREEAHAAEIANRLGVEARTLSAAETAALEPDVKLAVVGSIYWPLDCHLSPRRFVSGLVRDLEAGGATFHWNTEALDWRVENGRVAKLATSAGELAADEFVLAAGSWSPRTTRGLGLRLPVQAGKGYSVMLEKPRRLPQICSLLMEARIAVTPMQGQLRVAGTMEFGGLDESIDTRRVRAIFERLPEYLPDFTVSDFEGLPPWRGLRPCSPDGMPYIGRTSRLANFTVATGHAMMGLSLAPATGKLVADTLAGRTTSIPLRGFEPERFG